MSWEHCGDRLRVFAGDCSCEDDPRGREFSVSLELGIATGEFDAPKHLYDQPTKTWGGRPGPNFGCRLNPDYREYGSWGFAITLWRWGLSFAVRGPVLGSYPKEDDESP